MRTKSHPHPDLADLEPLVAPGRVCKILDCTFEQLTEWGRKGLIDHILLPGGGKRYRVSDLRRIATGEWR